MFRADNGGAVAKACVHLDAYEGQSRTRTIQSAGDGTFVFEDVVPGDYKLRAGHPGFAASEFEDRDRQDDQAKITLSAGQRIENMNIKLTPTGIISGTVTDEDNEPVPGLGVKVYVRGFRRGGGRILFDVGDNATTDDRGNFRIAELAAGSYYIQAGGVSTASAGTGELEYRDTYYPGTFSVKDARAVVVRPGEETSGIGIGVRLERSYSINGQIIDPETGVGDREYLLRTQSKTGGHDWRREWTPVDNDGMFEVGGVLAGTYQLTAEVSMNAEAASARGEAAKWAETGSTMVNVFNTDAKTNIFLNRNGMIRGKLTLANGQTSGLEQLAVTLVRKPNASDGEEFFFGLALTEDVGGVVKKDGHFVIEDVPPGTYVLLVSLKKPDTNANVIRMISGSNLNDPVYAESVLCGGNDYGLQPLVVPAGNSSIDCQIRVRTDTGTVRGLVMEGDKPAQHLIVIAIPQSSELRHLERYTLTAESDHNGRYQITGLIPGDYFLFAVHPDNEDSYFSLDYGDRNQASAEIVSVKPNESKTVNLKPSVPQ